MDNYKSQQMQNWKKTLIIDPLLNNLFDHNLNVKDFIHQKILTLEHQQIVHIYTLLSSVKHAISKQIHRQVQLKYQLIQNSFKSKHKITLQLKLDNQKQVQQNLKKIQNFNANYKNVQQNVNKLENINKIIRFGKALQKFKINCRLLKTFMKDHITHKQAITKQQQLSSKNSINSSDLNTSQSSLNLPKISKLIKQLSDLMKKFDFNGIKYYQIQKQFINSSKGILYSLTQKQLNKTLLKYQEFIQSQIKQNYEAQNKVSSAEVNRSDKNGRKLFQNEKIRSYQDQIKQKFKVLHSINRLKQFMTTFLKKMLKDNVDILKNIFQTYTLQDFKQYFYSTALVTILSSAKLNLRLQQILLNSMLSKSLSNSGLPNLFQKFIQRVISYFYELIKWNQEQDVKDLQKRKSQYISINDNNRNINEFSLLQIKGLFLPPINKSNKQKYPLVYKYPILLNGMSILVNKIHQQLLLYCEYNQQQYQFHVKKQKMMKVLLPLSAKFHQIFNQIINFDNLLRQFHSDSSRQNGQIDQGILNNLKQSTNLRIQCLAVFYDKIMGIKNSANTISELSVLIQSINERAISHLENLLESVKYLESDSVTNQIDMHQTNMKLLGTIKNSFANKIFQILNRKQSFLNYSHIDIFVDHFKKIKTIQNQVETQKLIGQLNQLQQGYSFQQLIKKK